jgi:putative transposase
LVEKHNISIKHKYYKELDNLAFLSKNLYNMALYNIRQQYFNFKTYLTYNDNYELIKSQKNDYESLPRMVSQQVLRQLNTEFSTYFKALKSYNKNPEKFKGRPQMPKYKDKKKGRNILTYIKATISRTDYKKGILHLSQTNIKISTKISYDDLICVRVVKKINSYVIEICYNVNEPELKADNGIYAGGDLGINNLITVVINNNTSPIIINGRPLKSINQYYNKELARLKSEAKIKNNKDTTKNIKKLTGKRNNKINDYMHKASKILVNHLVSMNICKLGIGKNKAWKQDVNIGSKNNQNFVSIPYNIFISMLTYKLKLKGIDVILNEESYTSKCSFLDNESIGKHEKYCGSRIKRGLFKTKNGILINADVNAAFNILKKAMPKAFAKGIEGLVIIPVKLSF